MRRKVQIILQDPYSTLNPYRSVASRIDEVLKVHGMRGRAERDAETDRLLGLVGFPLTMRDRLPGQLSGGGRQRVSIARALAVGPRADRRRRTGVGAGRLGAGAGAEPVREAARRTRARLRVHHPRPRRGAAARRPHRGHVPRPGRRGGPGRSSVRATRSTPTPGRCSPRPRTSPSGAVATRPHWAATCPTRSTRRPGCVFHPRCPAAMDVCRVQVPPSHDAGPGRSVACHLYPGSVVAAGDRPPLTGDVTACTDIASRSDPFQAPQAQCSCGLARSPDRPGRCLHVQWQLGRRLRRGQWRPAGQHRSASSGVDTLDHRQRGQGRHPRPGAERRSTSRSGSTRTSTAGWCQAEPDRHQDRARPGHQLGHLDGQADLHLPPARREVLRRHARSPRRTPSGRSTGPGSSTAAGASSSPRSSRSPRRTRRPSSSSCRKPHAPLLADLAMYAFSVLPQKAGRGRRATSSSPTPSAAARSWSRPTTPTPRSTSRQQVLVRHQAEDPERQGPDRHQRQHPGARPAGRQGRRDREPAGQPDQADQRQPQAAGRPVPVDPRRLHPAVDEEQVLRERQGAPGGQGRDRPRRDEHAGLPGQRDPGDLVHAVQDAVLGHRQPAQADVDLAKAKQLLTEAGFPNGFTTNIITVSGDAAGQAEAVVIKDDLAKIGITVNIESYELVTAYDKERTGNYGLGERYWTNDIIDPDEVVTFGVDINGRVELLRHLLERPDGDQAGQRRPVGDRRRPSAQQMYKQIQQIVSDQAPYLPARVPAVPLRQGKWVTGSRSRRWATTTTRC